MNDVIGNDSDIIDSIRGVSSGVERNREERGRKDDHKQYS